MVCVCVNGMCVCGWFVCVCVCVCCWYVCVCGWYVCVAGMCNVHMYALRMFMYVYVQGNVYVSVFVMRIYL